MTADIGDSVAIAWNIQDATGVLTNASTVTLTITHPDGTIETPTVTNPPAVTGQYRYTYVPATSGRYVWSAVSTGPNTAYADVIDVRENPSPSLLSIADAKAALNITASSFDDELREYCEAVTWIVEDFVGPIVQRTYTRRMYGYSYMVRLPHTQVQSISAIVLVRDGSSPVTISDLAIDSLTGVVTYKNGITRFPYGELDFTYQVGRTTIQANWTLAAKLILQHNWKSQLGELPSPQGDDETYAWTGRLGASGIPYFVPPRALALLSHDNSGTGWA